MTTERKYNSNTLPKDSRLFHTMKYIYGACILFVLSVIGYSAEKGASSTRILNPEWEGETSSSGVIRPVDPILPQVDWVALVQWGTAVVMIVGFITFVIAWVRNPKHPTLLMMLAATAIVWQDPMMNWVSFAVYNPQLWHLPVDLPWINISPAIEPFVVIAYAAFYVSPYYPAIHTLRSLQTKRGMDAFVWRHPLVCLGLLAFGYGFILDAFLEIFCVSTQIYIYAQVPPIGTLFAGEYNQFPLLWQSTLVTLVMIPASVLLYRDDTGRSVAEKLSQRLRLHNRFPALATFIIMFGTLNLAYFAYGFGFWIMKAGHFSTSVACPWPYPEIKVYDPQGYYQKQGQPGPFYSGYWATWASGNGMGGRPNDIEIDPNGYCEPSTVLAEGDR